MLVMVLLVCDSVALHHHLGLYHQGTVLMINTSRELVLMQGHFYCFNCVYWLFYETTRCAVNISIEKKSVDFCFRPNTGMQSEKKCPLSLFIFNL